MGLVDLQSPDVGRGEDVDDQAAPVVVLTCESVGLLGGVPGAAQGVGTASSARTSKPTPMSASAAASHTASIAADVEAR